jgi:hypothetical protein
MNYLEKLAQDIKAAVPSDAVPNGDNTDLFVLYASLLLAKGSSVTAADVHNAWAAWMTARGQGDHQSVVPFEQLSPEVQQEDSPFLTAIRQVASKP